MIGNGDITTPHAAARSNKPMPWNICWSGCIYNLDLSSHPTIPRNWDTSPEPTFEERIRILRRHYDLMIEVFGEERGSLQFRKVAPWYAKDLDRLSPSIVRSFESVHGQTSKKYSRLSGMAKAVHDDAKPTPKISIIPDDYLFYTRRG